MKLEDQVITVDQAIRLKELGVKQESIWSWYITTDRDDTPSLNRSDYYCPTCGHPRPPYYAEVAAFGVAELGQMLPPEFMTWFDGQVWHCTDGYDNPIHMTGITEAQAKAAELISRLEATWISVDEVNTRL